MRFGSSLEELGDKKSQVRYIECTVRIDITFLKAHWIRSPLKEGGHQVRQIGNVHNATMLDVASYQTAAG